MAADLQKMQLGLCASRTLLWIVCFQAAFQGSTSVKSHAVDSHDVSAMSSAENQAAAQQLTSASALADASVASLATANIVESRRLMRAEGRESSQAASTADGTNSEEADESQISAEEIIERHRLQKLKKLEEEHQQVENDRLQAWSMTSAWLRKFGASVNPKLQAQMKVHAGHRVRGVVANDTLKARETLLVIPKRLWLHENNWPSFRYASGPPNMSPKDLSLLKLTAILASETVKGSDSQYAAFIQRMPTMEEFNVSHPRMARERLVSDFGALRLMSLMQVMQQVDTKLAQGFEDWKKMPEHPSELDSLTWEDMFRALLRVRSRRIAVEDGTSALIPAVDLMNTAADKDVNAVWQPENIGFTVNAVKPIEPGQEILIDYCSNCDNQKLLAQWGMYLEGNPNKLDPKKAPDCLSVRSDTTGRPVVLREVAEAVLDLASQDAAGAADAKSGAAGVPRCKEEGMQQLEQQGPLRCALARLAWEYCGDVWQGN